ncbi:hypothetical protein [Cellulomonas sp. C5510]|uniref:hypothetical protein n=1 Tax=Cellulomonas sp. C5510 TaxID=2871170 RepID=UPI001C96A10C|nr:hypothetical protein [Cellulomonas sp. C5510]QZN85426.1 hypothetical protein K5O09_16945 [Cellulomonas sp. C5510]
MNQPAPDRSITGLQRRRPGAAGLIRGQRSEPQHAARAEAAAVTRQLESDEGAWPAMTSAKAQSDAQRPRRNAAIKASKGQVNVEIATDVRDQARAAFRAAAYFEGVPTFAQFVENAIRHENERVQREHNSGLPFEPISENLPAGRPVGGSR